MITKQKQLLCTFSTKNDHNHKIEEILAFYNVIDNKIFIFVNTKDQNDYYLTYNVFNDRFGKLPNTISIHRKKEFNALYTLNAMNKLIEEENGVFDNKFQINWNLYKNSLIVTDEIGTRIVSLKLLSII